MMRPQKLPVASPRGGNRGCLCKDNTYSRKCCDGSLQAQGIGNIFLSTPPHKYSVRWNASVLNIRNITAAPFTITGGEFGNTYHWSISDGITLLTGSGTMDGTLSKSLTTNVSSLIDGTITLSVYFTNPLEGGIVSATIEKESPLLDRYTGAAGGYSLRLLSAAYEGAAIRVRRSSDNTEQDIGFVYEDLDIDALNTFCSGTNGYVVTWYDQSGNGNNATQSFSSSQPQIYYQATGILLVNGKPAMSFNGTAQRFDLGVGTTQPASLSAFLVRNINNYPFVTHTAFNWKNWAMSYNRNGGTTYGKAHFSKSPNYYISSDYSIDAGQALDTIIGTTLLERNATAVTLTSKFGYNAGTSGIARYGSGVQQFAGRLQELVIYESDKTSIKSNIHANINAYFSLY